MAAKRKSNKASAAVAAAEPNPYTDYIVRYSKPGVYMRTQVLRAADEADAVVRAQRAVAVGGPWAGWAIVDIMTVDEAKARQGGSRG